MTRIKTLNVRKTSREELNSHFPMKGGIPFGKLDIFEPLYIRCRADGSVNWDSNWSFYTATELIEKNNVKILKKSS
jgi:hypothetical protein